MLIPAGILFCTLAALRMELNELADRRDILCQLIRQLGHFQVISRLPCYGPIDDQVVDHTIPNDLDFPCVVVDGKIAVWAPCDQYKRKEEPFVPAALSFPSTQDARLQQKARNTIQEIITKTGLRQGPCNVEYLVDKSGRVWILEIGPRNGGNLIPLLIEKSTGVNLIELTVRLAVGDTIELPPMQRLCYAMTVVHRQNHQTTELELVTSNSPLRPSWE